jgi:hypothetical protein
VNPEKFIITTQYTWKELLAWSNDDEKLLQALSRRFPVTEVTHANRVDLFGELLDDGNEDARLIAEVEQLLAEEACAPTQILALSGDTTELDNGAARLILQILYRDFPDNKDVLVDDLLAKVEATSQDEWNVTTLKGFLYLLDSNNQIMYADDRNLIHKI